MPWTRVLHRTLIPNAAGDSYEMQLELVPVGSDGSCSSLGEPTSLPGTFTWTFSTGSPGHLPADPMTTLPTGSASVGASGYPSAGTPIWYSLDLDRGVSPVSLGVIRLTYQNAYTADPDPTLGPSLWASDDGSTWTMIVGKSTWVDSASGTIDEYDVEVPTSYRTTRYLRFRTDDLFVSGYWPGTTWENFLYRECIE